MRIAGEDRWDIRMAAWLLYMKQRPDSLWISYLKHLPREHDMCCLLNYNRDEILELQIPALQVTGSDHCSRTDCHACVQEPQLHLLMSVTADVAAANIAC